MSLDSEISSPTVHYAVDVLESTILYHFHLQFDHDLSPCATSCMRSVL